MIGVYISRNQDTDPRRGKTIWRHREEMAIYRLRREASEETHPANPLTSRIVRKMSVV